MLPNLDFVDDVMYFTQLSIAQQTGGLKRIEKTIVAQDTGIVDVTWDGRYLYIRHPGGTEKYRCPTRPEIRYDRDRGIIHISFVTF